MSDWQPQKYLAFAEERARPARDLLAQVPLDDAPTVYDLGCGPGNSTTLLVERFARARVIGIDSSPAMLAAARLACPAARLACPAAEYCAADLATWQPEETPDLLFSNATLQWVPDHLAVLARLVATLRPGGVLAVQMPDNLAEPSHRLMREVAEAEPWAAKLKTAAAARDPLPPPEVYYRHLKPFFTRLDIWHTVYNHALAGASGIVDWVSSTGLRPYLDPLDVDERAQYLAAYKARIATAYPAMADGTVLLRFPRLFLAGVR